MLLNRKKTLSDSEILAMLQWQLESGIDEAICETPLNRFEEPAQSVQVLKRLPNRHEAKLTNAIQPKVTEPFLTNVQDSSVQGFSVVNRTENSLESLKQALHTLETPLKKTARQLVFADGNPKANVMFIGDAPNADEDRYGRPFLGRSGNLFDKMLAAIALDRTASEPHNSVYLTSVLPWRLPSNRSVNAAEIAMIKPFLFKHIQLVNPKVIVPMGNTSTQALLSMDIGIMRLRGKWAEVTIESQTYACLPMFTPSYLLNSPLHKAKAWQDLLMLRNFLNA